MVARTKVEPAGQRHDPKHGDLARPEHDTARSKPCLCWPKACSELCLGRPFGPPDSMARHAFNSKHDVNPVSDNLWNLKYQVLWLVKLVTFGMWNMICEYIVLCELWSINICNLNVIYLCFVEFCIKFDVFHIADHESAQRTIGPRAFRLFRPENQPTCHAWAVRQARWLVEGRSDGPRAIGAHALSDSA